MAAMMIDATPSEPVCPGAPIRQPLSTSKRLLVLPPNGPPRWHYVIDFERLHQAWNIRLEDLQQLVGGYIEPASIDKVHPGLNHMLPRTRRWAAFVNEEGRLRNMSTNMHAPYFVGPIVIGVETMCGNVIGINDDELALMPDVLIPK